MTDESYTKRRRRRKKRRKRKASCVMWEEAYPCEEQLILLQYRRDRWLYSEGQHH
jgi:hypothetical protein